MPSSVVAIQTPTGVRVELDRASALARGGVEALARILQLDVSLRLDQQQTFMVTISGIAPSIMPSSAPG